MDAIELHRLVSPHPLFLSLLILSHSPSSSTYPLIPHPFPHTHPLPPITPALPLHYPPSSPYHPYPPLPPKATVAPKCLLKSTRSESPGAPPPPRQMLVVTPPSSPPYPPPTTTTTHPLSPTPFTSPLSPLRQILEVITSYIPHPLTPPPPLTPPHLPTHPPYLCGRS